MRELLREDMTTESVRDFAAGLEGNARIRLNAVASAYAGAELKDIVLEAGVPPETVMDWILLFKEDGPKALARKTDPGRLPSGYDADLMLVTARARPTRIALMAAAMAYRGAPAEQVAEYLAVEPEQVARWLVTLRKSGPEALGKNKKRKKRAPAAKVATAKLPRQPKAAVVADLDSGEGKNRYRLRQDYDAVSLFAMKDDFLAEHRPRFAALVAAYMTSSVEELASQRGLPVETLIEWLDDFNVEGIDGLLSPGSRSKPLDRPAWPQKAYPELTSAESSEKIAKLLDAEEDVTRNRANALQMLAAGVPIEVVARRTGQDTKTLEGCVASHAGTPHLLGAMMSLSSAETS